MIENHFIKEGNKLKVSPEIRKMVIFAVHDFTKNPPYHRIDLLSCRNVLIYLSPDLQRKALSIFHFSLNLKGYLMLGPSETAEPIKEKLETISKKWNIFQNVIPSKNFSFEQIAGLSFKPDFISETASRKLWEKNYYQIVCDFLAESIPYGAVFINENYEILEGVGNYNRYLKLPEKGIQLNLLKMVPEELSIAVGSIIRSSIKINEKVSMQNIKVKDGDLTRVVNLEVQPFLKENKFKRKFILVVFNEVTKEKSKDLKIVEYDKDSSIYERLSDLEVELSNTKQNLQYAIEQLESANEELQSTNEELISANEELQSTNEELQSLNEELHTVNAEHQSKIKELVDLNDDLNNYFRSTHIGQIFVDNDLIIRKYTPGAIHQINLIEADIGRPITHISNNIKYDNLFDDIRKCIETSEVFEKEVEGTNGRYYQMRIFPYIKLSREVAGVVVSFVDVTNLKIAYKQLEEAKEKLNQLNNELEQRVQERTKELSQAKEELQHSNQHLRRVNADLDNFVYTASHDLKAPISNIEALVNALIEIVPMDDEIKELFDMITVSVNRFKNILKDLTDITKVEKEIPEDVENQNILDLYEEICFNIRSLISDSNAKICLDIEVPEIRFSRKNFRSIIYNLISNAIKYRSPFRELRIHFSTYKSGEFLVLSVTDNGMGIPEYKKTKVFDMFKRFHHDIEGTGVGLYIVKRIVDNTGGKIEVESKEGSGTTFRVYLKDL